MKTEYVTVLVTTKDQKQATTIAKALLEARLIACANMIPGVQSMFRWEGKIDHAKEVLLLLKTKRTLFKKLSKKVRQLHSYQTPEIIALPIIAGDKRYMTWLGESAC